MDFYVSAISALQSKETAEINEMLPCSSWLKHDSRWLSGDTTSCQSSSVLFFMMEKKLWEMCFSPFWDKWQNWNESTGVSMKIYQCLKNPIIRHSGNYILDKPPILWVIITSQNANCFSICSVPPMSLVEGYWGCTRH